MRLIFIHSMGAWLLAAPFLFAQNPPKDAAELLRLNLNETPNQVAAVLGRPDQTSDAGNNYFAWNYRRDAEDNHDFSHMLVFGKTDQQLVSVTRNLPEPVRLESLLGPGAQPVAYYWPDQRNPQMKVRVAVLGADRLVVSMGENQRDGTTQQILLIRRSALRQFLPWLDERLTSKK